MKEWIKRTAVLWLEDHAVYLAKKEMTLLGSCRAVLADTFSDIRDTHWLEEDAAIQSVLETVSDIYGLAGYTVRIVVSGPRLFWACMELPVSDYQAAREALVWNESIADDLESRYYDVCRISSASPEGMYSWLTAAYPKRCLDKVCQSLRTRGNTVISVEPLPLLIIRDYAGDDGQLLIWEYDHVHTVEVISRIPRSYTCQHAESRPFSVGFRESGTAELGRPLWSRQRLKFWQDWQLSGPAALLL